MASHFFLLLVFAAFVSVVFAVLLRDDPRGQLRLALALFGGFVGTGFVFGWLMYPLPV